MKKVIILDASMRKGYTHSVAEEVVKRMSKKYETEMILLKDENIEMCKGCCSCLIAGSSHCPLKADGVQALLHRITAAEGIIYIVPNYSLQVPAKLKNLLDRLAYVFHRPRLFHKVFMPIVVQGVYGGGKIGKYLNEVMGFLGDSEYKGNGITGGIYPKQIGEKLFTQKNIQRVEKALFTFDKEMARTKPKKQVSQINAVSFQV